jgi:hypothetical protein
MTMKGDGVHFKPRPRRVAGVAIVALVAFSALTAGASGRSAGGADGVDTGQYAAQMATPAAVVPLPTGPARPSTQPAARTGVQGSGPVLVLTQATDPYTDDVCGALLATAGFSCASVDAAALTPAVSLSPYRVVIVADQVTVTRAQRTRLETWVQDGGHLIGLRPLDNLRKLFGLDARTAVLGSGYLRGGSRSAPAAGALESIQVHSPADVHEVVAAKVTAWMLGSGDGDAVGPAITQRALGRGTADAWTFDPAQAVMNTRDGDSALTGRRTVSTDGLARMQDRMGEGFLDDSRLGLPQADLLLNRLTAQIAAAGVPRTWYLPNTAQGALRRGAIVLTGDDHNIDSQSVARFTHLSSLSPKGCSVADWTCLTATAYTFPGALSAAAARAWTARGFEVEPHFAGGLDHAQCAGDSDPTGTAAEFLDRWQKAYPGLPAPTTTRWHCYGLWSSYAGIPDADQSLGITADASSACWPQAAFGTAPCFVTGTALPMPFADADGRLTGVLQLTTQITDENPVTASVAGVHALLTQLTGYATVLAHLDNQPQSHALMHTLVAQAHQLGLPIISARLATQFWTARAATTTALARDGRFAVSGGPAHLTVLVPVAAGGRQLSGITAGGSAVALHTQTLGGVEYAVVPDAEGAYRLSYSK